MSVERQAELLADDLTITKLMDIKEQFIKEFEAASESDRPSLSPSGFWLQAYGFSKACLNAATRVWAREHPRLKVVCCTPGFVKTDMVEGTFHASKSIRLQNTCLSC